MREKEKMINGLLYNPMQEDLFKRRMEIRRLVQDFNNCYVDEDSKRKTIMKKIFTNCKNIDTAFFEQNIRIEYGYNIVFGKNFYMNYDCTLIDVCPITIGDNVMFGPRTMLVTPMHPLDGEERKIQDYPDGTYDIEYGKPITIGNNVWLCSNVTIVGGVKIGNNCVIGSGSVVTRDIPDNSLAFGVPCRVIRKITEKDKLHVYQSYLKEQRID